MPQPLLKRVWRAPRYFMHVAAALRAEQTDNLVAVVRQAGRPLVVSSDFNSPPGSWADRAMHSLLESAFAAGGSGFGWSFPARWPLLRIDHLFLSPVLRVLDCRGPVRRAFNRRLMIADLTRHR